jgi:hypothetical protein
MNTILVMLLLLPACASKAARPASPVVMSVAVMMPMIRETNNRGNVGRDWETIQQAVAARILESARQRDPGARLIDTMPIGPAATKQSATHLIVPSILQWTQMRTDDPIGALISRRNHITIALRLMRLQQAPVLECEITFTNRARLTLNQRAERLLDRRFHAAVLQLLSCAT